ncbi:MAG: 50S ribosomal protein L9 [Desulfobacteraceae bacterium]|nr:50S ribosomal protein L9 [Desulfobacteraceae bacterium]
MKVILTENIASLGQIGQIVNVAPGYARNFLFPKELAMEATGRNVKELEHRKRILAQKREKVHQEMLSLAEKLSKVEIVMRRKVAEDDKLYGSVNAAEILAVLEEQGFELARKDIQLDQPVKQLGEFSIAIRVDAEVTANVKLVIEKEE